MKHRAEDLTARDVRLRDGAVRQTTGRTPSLKQATPGLDATRPLRDLALRGIAMLRALLGRVRRRGPRQTEPRPGGA